MKYSRKQIMDSFDNKELVNKMLSENFNCLIHYGLRTFAFCASVVFIILIFGA
jgi:hypothetical protein